MRVVVDGEMQIAADEPSVQLVDASDLADGHEDKDGDAEGGGGEIGGLLGRVDRQHVGTGR